MTMLVEITFQFFLTYCIFCDNTLEQCDRNKIVHFLKIASIY